MLTFPHSSISIVENYKQAINERRYPFHSIMFSYVTVNVNVVTCEYIDFYLTAYYSLLYYSQCSHMCQVKVNVVTCEYIDLKIVPSPSIYMKNSVATIVCSFQQCSMLQRVGYNLILKQHSKIKSRNLLKLLFISEVQIYFLALGVDNHWMGSIYVDGRKAKMGSS